ncbi:MULTISPECIES: hypothetical protein [unclassified Microcoleus]
MYFIILTGKLMGDRSGRSLCCSEFDSPGRIVTVLQGFEIPSLRGTTE